MALHDSLQYRTFDLAGEAQPNSTVADRFYTLVMNSPAIGMATVFNLGRKHLSKLRRLPKRQPRLPKGGAPIAFAYEQLISNIGESLLGDIPAHFDLQDKAHFALGFYHQKAYRPTKKKPSASPLEDATTEDVLFVNHMEGAEAQAMIPETNFFEESEQ